MIHTNSTHSIVKCIMEKSESPLSHLSMNHYAEGFKCHWLVQYTSSWNILTSPYIYMHKVSQNMRDLSSCNAGTRLKNNNLKYYKCNYLCLSYYFMYYFVCILSTRSNTLTLRVMYLVTKSQIVEIWVPPFEIWSQVVTWDIFETHVLVQTGPEFLWGWGCLCLPTFTVNFAV